MSESTSKRDGQEQQKALLTEAYIIQALQTVMMTSFGKQNEH